MSLEMGTGQTSTLKRPGCVPPITTARRPSPKRVALEAATLRQPCLWTARRQTEQVLGANRVGRASG